MFKALKDVLPGMIDELASPSRSCGRRCLPRGVPSPRGLPAHARDARPFRFQQGTLTIQTSSSAAVHELHMRVPQLTRELNTKLGRPLVTKLELRVRGQRPSPRTPTGTQLPPSQKDSPQATATVDDADRERRLRQAIDLIENPTVRQQALARLAGEEEQESDRCALCGVHVQHPRPLPALPSARGAGKRKVRRVRIQCGGAGGTNTRVC